VKFEGCDDKTYNAFSLDVPTSRKSDIETLLNNNVRVLLFNGQLDYIVNTPGAIAWIN
jgi:carboxypeptidase C (cathepsin A)